MWQTNISFCSSCSEECHITSLTHLLPTAVASCVAGLYGFVPRVRLNRLNWPKVVKMGSTPKKKRSFVEMVTQVVVATQVPRYPELILSLATVILRGISSVVRSMPCYWHANSYVTIPEILAAECAMFNHQHCRFPISRWVLLRILLLYIIAYWSWLYKFMPTILQQKRCLFAQNAI